MDGPEGVEGISKRENMLDTNETGRRCLEFGLRDRLRSITLGAYLGNKSYLARTVQTSI